ncbi:conserved hypothetical protein [Leishmania major strain Friedlin]|uniref:Uncharacterized protein n=1 Tax=Leishmania major TaxID=5664 RepID=Q4Q463_LEIMA|nr:conserved hypothetical protein [Leishmania major strain Friedlin]CAG9580702.1 hypothetical_protein_-_conserved [Leishmania major strain Friedlin]CAJ06298.2 conserved hypothetical protein [Leishmania major strain Friedlin]|eukprot:XP_001685885.2 conserved hypothetical protein [Leishmania major strain Friedlin]
MDITPSSSCALRKRLLGLFGVYSTAVSNGDGVCEVAEVRRLEATRYHACLNALARLSSFRKLFAGSEDDMAIRAAATQLQSRPIQDILWRAAVRRDANCARQQQQQRLNPLEVERTAAPWPSSDDYADADFLGEACYSPSAFGHGIHSTPSKDAGAAGDARGSISWNALHSVLVLYLYDHQCFHNSFLAQEVDALRRDSDGGVMMHTNPDRVCAKEKQIDVAAMTPPVRRKAAYANSATRVAAVQAAERRPCGATKSAAPSSWNANPPPSLQDTLLRQPNMEIAMDVQIGEEDAGRSLEPVYTLPCPPRMGVRRAPPGAPSLCSPVPTRHTACAASNSRCTVDSGVDPTKRSPPPRRKHTQREAAEFLYQQRHIGAVTDVEVVSGGQSAFHRAASVSVSSLSPSWSPPSGKSAVVPKRIAAVTRRQWSASPSPRRPASAAVVFGDEHIAASPTPHVACVLRLCPQSPSQQNAMAGQPREYHHRKHRASRAGAAVPTLVTVKKNARAQRLYMTRQPQPANPADATPELTTREGGTGVDATKQKMCLLVPQPLASRPVLAEAWPGRREYSCDLKVPPTTRHEGCFCEAEESASLLDIKLQRARTGERSDSGRHAQGRRTTSFAVGAPRGASAEASNRDGSMRPDWVRWTSPAKPPLSPGTPTALLRASVLPSRASSAAPVDVEGAASNQENQPPPTKTSRRRHALYQLEQPFPFTTGEPFAPRPLHEERHTGAAAAPAMVIPVHHATAPSPTPTPREDETDAWQHSAVHREASAVAPPPPLHHFTTQQVPKQRPRQPSQQLIGMPRLLFSPSDALSLATNRSSRVSSTEQQQKDRKLVPASTPTNPAAPALSPLFCETTHRPFASAHEMGSTVMEETCTPTRRWSPGQQSLTCRTPTSVVSPMNRQPPAPLSPASAKAQQQQPDGRSPPPRLSSRAKAQSITRGSCTLQTPPRVPSTRVLLSPSGSLQVTTPPSLSPPPHVAAAGATRRLLRQVGGGDSEGGVVGQRS